MSDIETIREIQQTPFVQEFIKAHTEQHMDEVLYGFGEVSESQGKPDIESVYTAVGYLQNDA